LESKSGEKQAPRRSSDSFGSEYSYLGDTGDIAEQLEEEDPLHIKIRASLDEEAHSRTPSRQRGRPRKRVQYLQQDHLYRKTTNPGVDKEAIHIPEPTGRYISSAEKLIALIMTGDSRESRVHGLTGKPLLYGCRPTTSAVSYADQSVGILLVFLCRWEFFFSDMIKELCQGLSRTDNTSVSHILS
jgi:hypothetical protein